MFSGIANIDLVEILFSLFWVFFIALVFYLHRESKREGYPLESDRVGVRVQGFPAIPSPKTYYLDDGRSVKAPRPEEPETVAGRPAARHPGAPLDPTGDPMLAGIGPGAYAKRSETTERTLDGRPRIVPMRAESSLSVDARDTDPRGMPVVAADGKQVGTVRDLWIDLAEPQVYFLEVATGAEGGAGTAMVPFGFAEIDKGRKRIRVNAIYSHQFDNVPPIASPDEITLREEDRIMAYFGGGLLFADSKRAEPFL